MIRHPSSVIIAGQSGSGKSQLTENLLREKTLFQVPPKKIVYCYDRWQPRFDRMKTKDKIQFYEGIPDPTHDVHRCSPGLGRSIQIVESSHRSRGVESSAHLADGCPNESRSKTHC